MWENYWLSALGSFLQRKNTLFFMAGLLSALFAATAHSAVVFADSATWEGDTIKYQGKTYTKMENPPLFPGISSSNPIIYQYQDGDNVSIIALSDDSDKTREITDAQIGTFKRDEGNNYSGVDPPGSLTIAAGESSSGGDSEDSITSCGISGIGWLICPPARWIANGMDLIYGWISDFLTVKPLSNDTSNGMYQAWQIALGFANTAFILAFLVIIYSHITSYGISNYEIKKMIPKLIVVAILVNVSYIICAIAVDLSNILGNSVQDALVEIRETLRTSDSTNDGLAFNFVNVTEFILSSGAIGGAVFAGYTAATGATAGGVISSMAIMLVPVLVAGLLSVAVALIILAARQALIVVLVVLAPLAFVAYLLPNTEKWFEKWRGLFMTMLMVFPLFSLLFGGSQLASLLILQSADRISMILLGLFIQVAPLALTPFLIQFSGSLLGRIAGMVNNPQKGLIDRTSNWAKDRAETRAAQRREEIAKNGGGSLLQRAALNRQLGQKNRDSWKERGNKYTDALWHNDARFVDHHDSQSEADLRTKTGEARASRHFEQRKGAPGSSLQRYVAAQRAAEEEVKMLQTREEANWQEMKSRNMTDDNVFRSQARAMRTLAEQQRIADGRVAAAQAMQKIEHANDLIKDEVLQQAVGGIADHGSQRALAAAVSEYRKDYASRIGEANAILEHYNLSSSQRQKHALGEEIVVYDDNRNMKILRKDSLFTREAAIDTQVKQGTYDEYEAIVSRSGSELREFRTTIASAIAEGGLSRKAVFMGGKTIDDVGQGRITDMSKLMQAVTSTIAKGKISANDLSTNDSKALERILQAARAKSHAGLSASEIATLDSSIEALKKDAAKVLENPNLNRDLKENARIVLEQIKAL